MMEKKTTMQEERVKILSNTNIAKDTWRMELSADMAKDMKPGQFVNIKIDGFMLRRPISISSVEDHKFVIVYKVVGDGTKKLSMMHANHYLDVFGPLGSSYPLHEEEDEILIIGGGVGVPPLYELAKQYRRMNKKVYVVLGFNDADSVFYEEEFKALDDENNDIKATFKRAEVKSNGLYDNAEYTLTITAQVSQANKEAAATWITDATNQTVKNFLNGLPTVNN